MYPCPTKCAVGFIMKLNNDFHTLPLWEGYVDFLYSRILIEKEREIRREIWTHTLHLCPTVSCILIIKEREIRRNRNFSSHVFCFVLSYPKRRNVRFIFARFCSAHSHRKGERNKEKWTFSLYIRPTLFHSFLSKRREKDKEQWTFLLLLSLFCTLLQFTDWVENRTL